MIFKQLFEPISSTYTYLLGCMQSKQAVLIDPAVPTMERDLAFINDLGLTLALTLETHVHADHITAALHLKERTGCKIGFPAPDNLSCADFDIEDKIAIELGNLALIPLYTPGHTDDHFCFLHDNKLFTGDCLLIDGCGRTDFQNGDSAQLFRSISEILYSLPDETLVYPGHDYEGRFVSSIGQEKTRNKRIKIGTSEQEFIKTMENLDLAHPAFIEYAVPGNLKCGECPTDLPDQLEKYCQQMTITPQG